MNAMFLNYIDFSLDNINIKDCQFYHAMLSPEEKNVNTIDS